MNISLIVAKSRNNIIGNNNALPWRLASDLKHFKALTMGKPIVMGRKTHESIGRLLPGRENIILSRDKSLRTQGGTLIHSIDALLAYCQHQPEIMIMGGATLYQQFLNHKDCSRQYVTEVHADIAGDTRFPDFDKDAWNEITRQDHLADHNNEYAYSFVLLEKNKPHPIIVKK